MVIFHSYVNLPEGIFLNKTRWAFEVPVNFHPRFLVELWVPVQTSTELPTCPICLGVWAALDWDVINTGA